METTLMPDPYAIGGGRKPEPQNEKTYVYEFAAEGVPMASRIIHLTHGLNHVLGPAKPAQVSLWRAIQTAYFFDYEAGDTYTRPPQLLGNYLADVFTGTGDPNEYVKLFKAIGMNFNPNGDATNSNYLLPYGAGGLDWTSHMWSDPPYNPEPRNMCDTPTACGIRACKPCRMRIHLDVERVEYRINQEHTYNPQHVDVLPDANGKTYFPAQRYLPALLHVKGRDMVQGWGTLTTQGPDAEHTNVMQVQHFCREDPPYENYDVAVKNAWYIYTSTRAELNRRQHIQFEQPGDHPYRYNDMGDASTFPVRSGVNLAHDKGTTELDGMIVAYPGAYGTGPTSSMTMPKVWSDSDEFIVDAEVGDIFIPIALDVDYINAGPLYSPSYPALVPPIQANLDYDDQTTGTSLAVTLDNMYKSLTRAQVNWHMSLELEPLVSLRRLRHCGSSPMFDGAAFFAGSAYDPTSRTAQAKVAADKAACTQRAVLAAASQGTSAPQLSQGQAAARPFPNPRTIQSAGAVVPTQSPRVPLQKANQDTTIASPYYRG